MKKRGFELFSLVIATIVLVVFLSAVPSASAEKITLKIATHYPVKHPLAGACNLWGKEIGKRTNGQVEIQWFHSSTLVAFTQTYDALRSGMVDMAMLPVAHFPNLFPVSVGVGLPFMCKDPEHAGEMFLKMRDQIPEFQKEWSEVKLFHIHTSDAWNFHFSDKDVKTLDEFKGLRVGTIWGSLINILKYLPCTGSLVPIEDLYVSLQRKTVDGVLIPNAAAKGFKVTDVTRFHTIANISVMPLGWAMSKTTWQKLPADVQKVFEEIAPSFLRMFSFVVRAGGDQILSACKDRGDVMNYVPQENIAKWRQKFVPTLYASYVENLNKKGYNGRAILEKMERISAETKNNPYNKIDEWWKQSPWFSKK